MQELFCFTLYSKKNVFLNTLPVWQDVMDGKKIPYRFLTTMFQYSNCRNACAPRVCVCKMVLVILDLKLAR